MASKNKYFHSDAKKVEVVTTYLILGKAPLVEAATGVPRGTIRTWKMQPWWKEMEADIRSEEDVELDGKLSKIVDRTLDTVIDRIEHGDYILDSRSGTVKRVPVKMKDAHKVSVDLIDKRNLLRGKPTSRVEKVGVDDTMLKLAEQFKEWAKLIKREVVIEGNYAIHDEREEGLQEREPTLQLSAQEHQEEDSPEQGTFNDGGSVRTEDTRGRGPHQTDVQRREEYTVESSSDESGSQPFLQPK